MAAPGELPTAWRVRADELRRYGAEAQAVTLESCAEELEEAQRARAGNLLTLKQAAEESGYSKRRLRELLADGTIPQAGRKHAPRIRRADLPMKPGREGKHTGGGYDAETDAAELAGRLT